MTNEREVRVSSMQWDMFICLFQLLLKVSDVEKGSFFILYIKGFRFFLLTQYSHTVCALKELSVAVIILPVHTAHDMILL